jgi:hypothetical protein
VRRRFGTVEHFCEVKNQARIQGHVEEEEEEAHHSQKLSSNISTFYYLLIPHSRI